MTLPRSTPPSAREAPKPDDTGRYTTRAKLSLAELAMALRDEQLEAKVVHYKADLETNAELDAITAKVASELQALQRAAVDKRAKAPTLANTDRTQIEIELISNLKEMLARLFKKGRLSVLFQRKLGDVSKQFARVFFQSELHENAETKSREKRTMRFAEQAMYHAMKAMNTNVVAQLQSMTYESDAVKEKATRLLDEFIKELRSNYLGRTTPELNALVKILNEVLITFITEALPLEVGELAWEVVKESKLADVESSHSYKVPASSFQKFRQTLERRFLLRLVPYALDNMTSRMEASEQVFRSETVAFVADPRIYSDVCAAICEAVYDQLYNDGFLDLPADWRSMIASG